MEQLTMWTLSAADQCGEQPVPMTDAAPKDVVPAPEDAPAGSAQLPAAQLPEAAEPDAPVDPAQLDPLLQAVIAQVRALGIPAAKNICPQVRLNARAKKRFGCCIGSPKLGFTIELSAALPAAGRRTCMQTLAHEVLHTCPGCQDHGPRWKAYAARMNAAYGYAIRRVDKPENLGVTLPPAAVPTYRWRVVCTGCGRVFFRQKTSPLIRQPSRYRCAACGGKLRVEALE